MRAVLEPGDTLIVSFANADGSFKIIWDNDSVRIEAELPDSTGRGGVIYEEKLRIPDEYSLAALAERLPLPSRDRKTD